MENVLLCCTLLYFDTIMFVSLDCIPLKKCSCGYPAYYMEE